MRRQSQGLVVKAPHRRVPRERARMQKVEQCGILRISTCVGRSVTGRRLWRACRLGRQNGGLLARAVDAPVAVLYAAVSWVRIQASQTNRRPRTRACIRLTRSGPVAARHLRRRAPFLHHDSQCVELWPVTIPLELPLRITVIPSAVGEHSIKRLRVVDVGRVLGHDLSYEDLRSVVYHSPQRYSPPL